jgi:hypothetical protein
MKGFSHQPVTGQCGTTDPNSTDTASSFAVGITSRDRDGVVAVKAFRVVFKGGSVVVPFSLEICPQQNTCPYLPGID